MVFTQTATKKLNWQSIAMSADGKKLAATVYNGKIWTSSNGGETWTENGDDDLWDNIVMSADGTKLAAAVSNKKIWTSSNGGETWTVASGFGMDHLWKSLAMSDDGTKLAAVTSSHIWTSSDSGSKWDQNSDSYDLIKTQNQSRWTSIAMSADGTKLAATVANGNIWTSNDSGSTWTDNTSVGANKNWSAIAMSADGTKLAATVANGNIWTSNNSGSTWTENTSFGENGKNWTSIAMSADGTKLAATVYEGKIWTSNDSGSTWNQNTAVDSTTWKTIVINKHGNFLAAVANISPNGITNRIWTSSKDKLENTKINIFGLGISKRKKLVTQKIEEIREHASKEAKKFTSVVPNNIENEQDPLIKAREKYQYFGGEQSKTNKLMDIADFDTSAKDDITDNYIAIDSLQNTLNSELTNVKTAAAATVAANLKAQSIQATKDKITGYKTSAENDTIYPDPTTLQSTTVMSYNNKDASLTKYKDSIDAYYAYGIIKTDVDRLVTELETESTESTENTNEQAFKNDLGTFVTKLTTIKEDNKSILEDLEELEDMFTKRIMGESDESGSITFSASLDRLADPQSSKLPDFKKVVSNTSGSKLIAILDDNQRGYYFLSTNGGFDWNRLTTPMQTNNNGESSWDFTINDIAMSADGSKVVITSHLHLPGALYLSNNGGASWARIISQETEINNLAMSADGNKIIITTLWMVTDNSQQHSPVTKGGKLYYSSDGGDTWNTHPNTAQWTNISISPNGDHVVATKKFRAYQDASNGFAAFDNNSNDGKYILYSSWSNLGNGGASFDVIANKMPATDTQAAGYSQMTSDRIAYKNWTSVVITNGKKIYATSSSSPAYDQSNDSTWEYYKNSGNTNEHTNGYIWKGDDNGVFLENPSSLFRGDGETTLTNNDWKIISADGYVAANPVDVVQYVEDDNDEDFWTRIAEGAIDLTVDSNKMTLVKKLSIQIKNGLPSIKVVILGSGMVITIWL